MHFYYIIYIIRKKEKLINNKIEDIKIKKNSDLKNTGFIKTLLIKKYIQLLCIFNRDLTQESNSKFIVLVRIHS